MTAIKSLCIFRLKVVSLDYGKLSAKHGYVFLLLLSLEFPCAKGQLYEARGARGSALST